MRRFRVLQRWPLACRRSRNCSFRTANDDVWRERSRSASSTMCRKLRRPAAKPIHANRHSLVGNSRRSERRVGENSRHGSVGGIPCGSLIWRTLRTSERHRYLTMVDRALIASGTELAAFETRGTDWRRAMHESRFSLRHGSGSSRTCRQSHHLVGRPAPKWACRTLARQRRRAKRHQLRTDPSQSTPRSRSRLAKPSDHRLGSSCRGTRFCLAPKATAGDHLSRKWGG